jgi:hypothetical protein
MVMDNDWLDAHLRKSSPYIPDDGFTAKVMKQLPAPARASLISGRQAILTSSLGAAAFVFFLLVLPWLHKLPGLFSLIHQSVADLPTLLSRGPLIWELPIGGLVLAGLFFGAMLTAEKVG